jgi:hypothetical protein
MLDVRLAIFAGDERLHRVPPNRECPLSLARPGPSRLMRLVSSFGYRVLVFRSSDEISRRNHHAPPVPSQVKDDAQYFESRAVISLAMPTEPDTEGARVCDFFGGRNLVLAGNSYAFQLLDPRAGTPRA